MVEDLDYEKKHKKNGVNHHDLDSDYNYSDDMMHSDFSSDLPEDDEFY